MLLGRVGAIRVSHIRSLRWTTRFTPKRLRFVCLRLGYISFRMSFNASVADYNTCEALPKVSKIKPVNVAGRWECKASYAAWSQNRGRNQKRCRTCGRTWAPDAYSPDQESGTFSQ